MSAATRDATAEGTVDFRTGEAVMRVRPTGANPSAYMRDPARALDVVRAVASVEPFGGAEVRGASTIKYELDVVLDDVEFYADVFIDSAGRIRRVSFPLDPKERRPSRDNRILAKVITIDFYDFGAKGPAT